MARLVSWPVGLQWSAREPLSGPRTIGAGSTEGLSGYVQTFGAAYGVWRWQFSFPSLRGSAFRRYRGMVTALHGGANAVRVPFRDPDGFSWAALGIPVAPGQVRDGLSWSNGRPWSNAAGWRIGRPWETVAAPAARGASIVALGSTSWGAKLDIGDMFGFVSAFALHVVTERLSGNRVRIWPPLRRDLTTADRATLTPTMAMRLESEAGANLPRGAAFAENLAITLIEVEHRHVAQFFAD